MSTLRPLSDRTFSSANTLNVGNGMTISSPTLKQNNPYAGSVLPMSFETIQPPTEAPLPMPPRRTSYLPPPTSTSTPTQRMPGSGFTMNPYAKARETLAQPAAMNPPQITKMYVDGRPVPVKKADSPPSPVLPTAAVVSIAFRLSTSAFFLDFSRLPVPLPPSVLADLSQLQGMHLIVDGDRGEDLGCVVSAAPHRVSDENLPRVRRVATAAEVQKMKTTIPAHEQAALALAQQQAPIALPMADALAIVDATFQFDQKKLTLWYTSNSRVYFVPLVRELNHVYRIRIWMQRIGSTDGSLSMQTSMIEGGESFCEDQC